MRLLIDTHAALWLLSDDGRLSPRAGELIADTSNEVLLSVAVVWEVAIKQSLGKLDAPDGFAGLLLEGGAVGLAISIDHANAVHSLPWHHRDPFDRMLVAQAGVEDAVILSNDERLQPYDIQLTW
ncbi:MAG TPA: type II toxin-antitoxin system VapC family toxin [Solirubrobacteraceae bacterium]|nr:type II toxin-antitoxin system VapC family toxin [Solirubrobacteraceae bacterium]